MSTIKTSQPKELYMLFFAEMWERFSFYGMRALLTLYMTKQLFENLTGGDPAIRAKAIGIYAAYGALVYATPFLGGIVADRLLGFKKSVMLGGLLMTIGHFVMAIETEFWLYIALAFLIIGNGFFKPNISSMVGGLYEENDPRRDGGFTIFYMGINLGAALAPLICGYIGETYGWSYGFALAGFGMILGMIVFSRGKDGLINNGDAPDLALLKRKVIPGINLEWLTYILAFASVFLFALLVKHYEMMSYVLTPFALGVILFLFIRSLRAEKIERERLWVILILLFFTTLFWAFFEQAGSSITLFTEDSVNRTLFGTELKTSIFQSVNPAFIILLGPIFATMWIKLALIGKEPSTPLKFALGIIQLGIGFLIFIVGAKFIDFQNDKALIPLIFLVLGYLLHTTGELFVSPVGLSMVTKLAPKKIMAMVMGAWFLSSAMAHHLGGIIAALTAGSSLEGTEAGAVAVTSGLIKPDQIGTMSESALQSYDRLANYLDVFGPVGWTAVGAGVLLLMMVPLLRKWMHGVH